jgi:hypothetical protein
MTIDQELAKLDVPTTFNRYHFLNFLPSRDWEKISASQLELDASLGFAEQYGFRNSYGSSFRPFDLRKQQAHDFVEAPLTFMDATFQRYMKVETTSVAGRIIGLYEKNSQDCHLSLLWHNTLFSEYKYGGFLGEYKKVLAYLHENRIPVVSPRDLIHESN